MKTKIYINGKLFLAMLGAMWLSGCASLDGLVIPTYFKPLDRQTVDFINDKPRINLARYAPQSSRPNQKLPDVDFMVVASGGGQRAAAFTMGVLTELEQVSLSNEGASNALSEVDYFTTVSGGGWAVGAYLTMKLDPILTGTLGTADMQDMIKKRLRTLEMGWRSTCLIEKLGADVTWRESGEVTFGEIFAKPGQVPLIPYLFSAATIQTNQEPFVFTQEFVDKYRVETFRYCDHRRQIKRDISQLPISVAIGTSSSVPGFRHTEVDTSICGLPDLLTSYLCKSQPQLDHMILVDGGMYDNLGYKTAIEVLSQSPAKHKVMLLIDSSADSDLPFTSETDVWDTTIAKDTAMAASLSAGYATYARTLTPLSEKHGINTIVIKFSSLAGFSKQADEYRAAYDQDPLHDLDALKDFSARYIECFGDDYRVHNESKPPRDCEENNLYRVGLFGKTSHAISSKQYDALHDLGRLAVRLETGRITKYLKGRR